MNKNLAIALSLSFLIGFVSCDKNDPEDNSKNDSCNYVVTVDPSLTGNVIPNLVSNVNVWSMDGRFVNPVVKSRCNVFDFVEYVQLMTATGGEASRDLFKDPADKTVLDDYDFSTLFANCHGILSLGAKPHLKLGNIPAKFTKEYKAGTFGVNVYAPEDYNKYYLYIKDLMEALVAEFGQEEVKTWHFGVFTEYENYDWFQGLDATPESAATEFCKIYDWTVQAVCDVLGPDVWIGAHSMTVTEGLWDEALFIQHCGEGTNWCTGEKGTHISYLSTSFYDTAPGRFTTGKTLPQCIDYFRTNAEKYGLSGLTYGVDEGRILGSKSGKEKADLYSRTVGYRYMAAYDARLYGQMLDCGGSYLSSWEYLSESLMEGNPSVSCHVAENISRMAGMNRVEAQTEGVKAFDGAEIKAYAGVDPASGKTTVMLYHFKNALTYNATATVKLSVKTDLRKDIVSCQIRKVDDNCNWFDEWVVDRKDLGITDDMFSWSPDDACGVTKFMTSAYARGEYQKRMAKYRECSILSPEDCELQVEKDGTVTLICKVQGNTVWFVDFE